MHRAFFLMIFRRLSWLSQSYSCFVCIIYTVASFRFVSFLLFGQVNRVSQLNRLSGIKRKRWVAKHRATTVNIITKPFISTNGEFVASAPVQNSRPTTIDGCQENEHNFGTTEWKLKPKKHLVKRPNERCMQKFKQDKINTQMKDRSSATAHSKILLKFESFHSTILITLELIFRFNLNKNKQ